MITVPFYNCVVRIRTTLIKKRGIIIFHETLELERKATMTISTYWYIHTEYFVENKTSG